jgi:hypothetical protein
MDDLRLNSSSDSLSQSEWAIEWLYHIAEQYGFKNNEDDRVDCLVDFLGESLEELCRVKSYREKKKKEVLREKKQWGYPLSCRD